MKRVSERTGEKIRETGHDRIPPHAAGLIHALREIGYKFDQAIADLIDNSITAAATRILIRFITNADKIVAIVVADDGMGMDGESLTEAMRFGAKDTRPLESLGKYGVGLKLASLSHARCLTVYSRGEGETGGRRWHVDEISTDGWVCARLDQEACAEQLDAAWGPLNLSTHGTIVEWSDIDKLPVPAGRLDAKIREMSSRLERHLGLCFHRFLEDGKTEIYIDRQEQGEEPNEIIANVEPLNPFPNESGHKTYPTYYGFDLNGIGRIRAEAHIWPPNSKSSRYKLLGGSARRQGFYIYRNDRLIQAGGWNGLVDDDREPHGSLARVRIDLPPVMDQYFSLNVQKAAVTPPPNFVEAVRDSRGDNGDSFTRYRSLAQDVYRKKDTGAVNHLPLVPRKGLPVRARDLAEEVLVPDGNRYRDVDIRWKSLGSADFVEFDRSARAIYLNTLYRKPILGRRRATQSDVPLLKVLVFLLMESYLDQNLSAKRRARLEQINQLLAGIARLGQG